MDGGPTGAVPAAEPWSVEEERIRAAYARRTQHASPYSWSQMAYVFQMQERERCVLRLLRSCGMMPLSDKRILEVGSGTGTWLRDFIKWGADPQDVFGVEFLPERVAEARRLLPPRVTLQCRNAAELPYPTAEFDIVLQSTMFSSIIDPTLKRQIAFEMVRVTKPEGILLWNDFHFNNPGNRDVRGVTKREIGALFPGCRIELHPVCLAPPLMRRLAEYSWVITYLLARVPFLCTDYLGVIRPARSNAS